MTGRVRVYGFLGILALAGGGYWANTKYAWVSKLGIGKSAQAGTKKDAAKKGGEADPIPVELAPVRTGQIAAHVSSSGNLRALRDVVLATQAEGLVIKVMAEEGDFVAESQALCQLDETPVRIRIDLAREKLAQARMQIEKARIREAKAKIQIEHYTREYDRYHLAHQSGLVSLQEAERRKLQRDEFVHDARLAASEITELNHRVGELQAEIAQAELDLSRTVLRAPFAGFITRRTVELGQRVRNLDPLFNLGAFSPLFADVFVPEREAQAVRPGQPATVLLGSADALKAEGRVQRLSPVVDQSSGTVKITVELRPTSREFRPGAFVRVDIRTDVRLGILLIPKRAVIEEDGQNYVYVVAGGKASRSKISLGYENEGVVEVRQGLATGQQIVVAGQGGLKEGSKIKAIQG